MQDIILAVLSSSALSAAVSGLFSQFLRRRQTNEAIELLLYHDIKTECIEYISNGYINADALEVLLKMHRVYHQRGGNGYLDRLMEEAEQLPIIEGGEKR